MKRFLGIIFSTLFIAVLFTNGSAHASNSRIIENSVYDNEFSMTENQINAFINAFNKSCLKPSNYPAGLSWATFREPLDYFNYTAYDVSPARIIYKSAKLYHINPQVLMTTLEKEQNLISGGAGCATWRYNSAMGYNCPDNLTLNTYPNLGITNTCVEREGNAGFARQVNRAAWQLSFDRHRAEGLLDWLGDGNVTYGGRMTQGWRARSIYVQPAYYDGYTTIDGQGLYLENGATAALYNYTPHFNSFERIFKMWFGTMPLVSDGSCDSLIENVTCVWSLRSPNGSQLLTTSISEVNSAIYTYGFMNEGIVFYASNTKIINSIPIFRLQLNGTYYFTANESEYNTLKIKPGWTDEGVAFYNLPPATGNYSHIIYKLYKPSNETYYLTQDSIAKDELINNGYVLQQSDFNAMSGFMPTNIASAGRNNIYRINSKTSVPLYTTSLTEAELATKLGFKFDSILSTSPSNKEGIPIYRLRSIYNTYLYTASAEERNIAINKYKFIDEGIGYYVDSITGVLYRLANTNNGSYLYIKNPETAINLVNKNGLIYEGTLTIDNTTPSPVYRFINIHNSRHFYTIDLNEVMRISNRLGWQYEGVAFYANKSIGAPVYRLRNTNKYLYTTDTAERDTAQNRFGYVYEGLVFYVNQETASNIVYRLQGGNDEYFYTISLDERDTAISKYRYVYEGTAFKVPSN